jgi:superfamily I DNA/RNA helicase
MDRDEMEPKPLFFKSNDEGEKIDWISKRILEIYNAYGNTIPSIAVFLSDESQLEFFADKLGETDRLADVGITVKACNKGQVLGDSNMVRVFSVEYIKGLEFEAVFYHNLDNLLELAQEDTTIKNLYVGLSRASFYMAITSSSDLKYFSYLEKYFNHNQQNWI